MKNLQNNKKLRTALQKCLAEKRELAECLGGDGGDAGYLLSEDAEAAYVEEAARLDAEDVAKIVISHLQQGYRPWATIHRSDIADCIVDLFKNEKYPTDSDLLEAISSGLDKMIKPCRVRIEFKIPMDLWGKSETPPKGLRRLLHIDWSESRLGITFLSQWGISFAQPRAAFGLFRARAAAAPGVFQGNSRFG